MTRLHSISSLGLVLAVVACGGVSSEGATGGAGPVGSGASSSGDKATGTGNDASVPGGGGAAPSGSAGSVSGGATLDPPNSAGSAGSSTVPVVLPPLVTSAPGAYWKTDGAFSLVTTEAADVTVIDTAYQQPWEGFGAAFNEMGWSALSSDEMKKEAMKLLFSASDGAAFAWGRIPIGASDYANSRYTLDDTAGDVTPDETESNRPPADTSLSLFSLARDHENLIPYIKAAQAVRPNLRFWASPWTPPVWMKTGFLELSNRTPVKKASYYDGGSIKNDPTILAAYAQYFSKFVEGYKAAGINIELVSPQTEPTWEQSYPSCLWDKAAYTAFIGQHLGPAMNTLGVKVMLGTLSNADSNKTDLELATAVLADASAKSFASVAGVQWGVFVKAIEGTRFGDLPIWETEHKGGNYPWNPAGYPAYSVDEAPNDHAYGVESWGYIRDAITKAKVTSYNAWNMVLDKYGWSIDTTREWGQNALLVADYDKLTPTPAYYVFRHVSQYVAEGAVVVGTSGGDAVAFKNPNGSLVAVVFNAGPAKSNFVVSIGGNQIQFAMPANGWATLTSPRSLGLK